MEDFQRSERWALTCPVGVGDAYRQPWSTTFAELFENKGERERDGEKMKERHFSKRPPTPVLR